ncbi:hypothetical protein H6764_00665 [Candidatus Nomurabacteria bacterium]|nr:hypothetical protein [Candidatus Nomurabacteria bacterium]
MSAFNGTPSVVTMSGQGEVTQAEVVKNGRESMTSYMYNLPQKVASAKQALEDYDRENPNPQDTVERDSLQSKLDSLQAVKFTSSQGDNQIGVFAIADEDGHGAEIVMLVGTDKTNPKDTDVRIIGAVFREKPDDVIYFVDEEGRVLKCDKRGFYSTAVGILRDQVENPTGIANLLQAYDNLMRPSDVWTTNESRFVNQVTEGDYYAVAQALYAVSLRFFHADVPDLIKEPLTKLYLKQPKPEGAKTFDV